MDLETKISASIGNKISCKGWQQEAALRMLQNNLNPDVAESPENLIVYGGYGKAARNWDSYNKIVTSLKELEDDETLLIQSGKPVAIFRTHTSSPRVLISNSRALRVLSRIYTICPVFEYFGAKPFLINGVSFLVSRSRWMMEPLSTGTPDGLWPTTWV